MKSSKSYLPLALLAAAFFIPVFSSAHVVVTPSTAKGNSYQTFVMGVPSERDAATVGARLLIPAGVTDVSPTVKPGWTINMKKQTVGGEDVVTEIDWTNGNIPAGFRDEFSFSAKVPATGTLDWKAYQTYSDNVVISWDEVPVPQTGAFDHDTSITGPYSMTTITAASATGGQRSTDMGMGMMDMSGDGSMTANEHAAHELFFPFIAIGLATAAFLEAYRRPKIKK